MNIIIRLIEAIWIEFKKATSNYPIPGEDAQWLAWCDTCKEYELHVSRGGFQNGKIDHCYCCGTEKELKGFKKSDIDQMKISSKWHWLKITGKPNYPKLPYDWHKLSESKKFSLLRINK